MSQQWSNWVRGHDSWTKIRKIPDRPPRALAIQPNSFPGHSARPAATAPSGQETHHYHHHYHHHYFPGGEAMAGRVADQVRDRDPIRDDKLRPTAALRGDMSRAEAAVR